MLKLAFQLIVGRVGCFWCFSVGAMSFEWTQGSWEWTSDMFGWIPRVNECTLGAWRWIAGASVCISRGRRSGDEMSECLGMVVGYMNQGSRYPMLKWDPRSQPSQLERWKASGYRQIKQSANQGWFTLSWVLQRHWVGLAAPESNVELE